MAVPRYTAATGAIFMEISPVTESIRSLSTHDVKRPSPVEISPIREKAIT